MKLYVFSGLGADKRAFSAIDFSGYEVIHMDWISPEPKEAMEDYVIRLAEAHQLPKSGATVIGVSFGGMCISELAKTYSFEKIIFLSSAKSKNELPQDGFWSFLAPLTNLIPGKLLTKPNSMIYKAFGVTEQKDKDLLAEIIRDTDPKFLKWAMKAIRNWENTVEPSEFLHVHGTEDRVIPFANVKQVVPVMGGGHFMVLNRGEEISQFIRGYLD
ncbi:alpha/beta fold hydrolase [Sphingobacterium hungaricum]|uniref:Alpha/beta hydrolase n=1 Tax=Sphingobacterium hungaricum TaxID=2082723 RepID=A0A928YQQ6_9SPHI|nr:alpha/beta hydrolase [Sphingobacterium hungaricum]MBE8713295.1 alpha/beta hydrolase [Sphingobacterium hungaricum]